MRTIEGKSLKIKDGTVYKDIFLIGDINMDGIKQELKDYIDEVIEELPIAEEEEF